MSSSLWDASWNLMGQSMPLSSLIVRIISIISMLIGIAFIFPVILFIIIDILLYAWRIYWSHFPSKSRNTSPSSSRDAMTNVGAITTATDAAEHNSKQR
ncbi:hypothetical protein PT974_11885 [Cladobotryum mycophilum]|uniref:Uncharacterized protein n=1 Tax=Cladobotryum mycophilum TaxID=491253 RepID=A0ABR0S7E6_9HYPO